MTCHEKKCCICGIALPNRWAVARQVQIGDEERYYCHLHAKLQHDGVQQDKTEEKQVTDDNKQSTAERDVARAATRERVTKAWRECSALATRLGGGVKTLWNKIHPDHSPETMLATLDVNLTDNATHRAETKQKLDALYREIVEKKKAYQTASSMRQRILKTELQTLLARYKGYEREFSILCENERSIETVKGRFLEILAYGRRGKLDSTVVDRLSDDVEIEADEAEDVQDALADLERAGRRKDRSHDDFDAELDGFDVEGDISETSGNEPQLTQKENDNEKADQIAGSDDPDGVVA